jgi:aminoglycoside phosphotransferase (APT) family kinase protein
MVDADRAIETKLMEATAGLLKRWVRDGALPVNQQTEAVMAVMALEQALAKRALPDDCGARLKASEQLAQAIECGGADLGDDAAKRLRAFLVDWYQPTDPEIDEGIRPIFRPFTVADDAGESPLLITASKLGAYLEHRFPERALQVERVDVLRGGYSKGTYIVTAREGGGEARFVLRQDKPGLPTGSSVADEYAALLTIHPRCPLAPQPLWLEDDAAVFGAAVMAVDLREGEPGRVLPTEPVRRRKWASSTAQLFGSLHSIRPEGERSLVDFMGETLRDYRAWHSRVEHSPHPGLAFGIAWLEAHLSDLDGRPVCRTHGDLAYHNILMKDDEVSAALDWEFTHFSDPVEDLSYMHPFIEEMGEWDAFMAEYTAITGFAYDEVAARWFGVFSCVRVALCNLTILHLLLTSDLNDVALIVAGAKLLQKWEIELLDRIAA